mgnify:CR=1 FL=1
MVRVGSSKTIFMSKIFMFFIAISCSCFTASWVGAQDLRATNFKVEPFDGRRGNKGDWTGAWIRLEGVTINGDRIGRSSVGFEFSGNYPNQPMRNFGFSSERTFTDLPRRAADRTHERLGYRFWVDARSGSQKARQKYQMLNETDKILMKGICGLMSDDRFVTNVLSQMTNSRPNSYRDYVDNKYNQYWGNERRKREVLRLANICNRGIGNAGSQKITFELKSMPSVKPSLCGFELENVQTISNLKSIQSGLAKRSLYSGGIDGKFGKGSCSALTKWSKCENVGSKVLSDGALSKLIKTNPSARELACYGKTTDNVAKLTFSDFQLRPVDGRSEGRDIVGSWITLRNVKIDGNPGAKKTIWFEILGRFPSQRMEMIGFSSKRTFENMPEYIGEKFGNPNLGYGFAVRTQNVAGTRSRFQQLDKNDRLVLKGICGLMANESFVADVVKKLESQKEFGFRDYVDNQFMKFWKKGSKAREIVSVAESCNRSVGNTGAKSVAFVSSNNSPSVTPASGSIAAVSSCNQRKLQVRSNQNVLKSLDLYTSTVDGVSGPNYRKAVAGGEKLIGQWADAKKDCLGVIERKILEAVVAARKRGSSCEYLPNSTEIKNRFNGLKSAGVTDKAKLDHEKASGLIWMIETVSELEMRLSFLNFYSSRNSSMRDCRLSNKELKALETKPVEPKPVVVAKAPTCEDDPALCSIVQLCGKAASTVNGDRAWNTDAKAADYVALAKSSGVTCGVKPKPVVVAKAPTCEDDPTKCSVIELCQQATGMNTSGEKFWRMDAALQAYVDTAKSTGVTCGVVSKVIETAKLETCENTPSKCSLAELCQRAISFETGKLGWTTTINGAPYVQFAKNSGMTCGVQENLVAAVPEQKQVEPPAPKKVLKYTNRKALVIGNANYVDQTPLKNPINDAKAVAAKLEQIGFEVTYKENLEYREFGRTLGDFEREVASSDISLIYYAGHGIEVDSVNYLIPVDAELSNPSDVKFETVMLEDAVRASLNTGKLSMVLVDACRDNPFAKSMIGGSRSVGRGLSIVDAQPGKIDQIISFAAESGEVAEDGTGNNSPYATSLLELLDEPNLEVGKLFRKLGDNVERMTNGKQIPVTRNRLSGEDIYLVVE